MLSQPRRLKYCTARSCFSAAARVLNVPRFLRLPVFGSTFCEYRRYSPVLSLRIILASIPSPSREDSKRVNGAGGVALPGRDGGNIGRGQTHHSCEMGTSVLVAS